MKSVIIELLPFLAFGAYCVYKAFNKETATAEASSADEEATSPVLEEVFPKVEYERSAKNILADTIEPVAPVKKLKQTSNTTKSSSTESSYEKSKDEVREAPCLHIAMKTRSDAKRAFIYSEIFNRKY